MLIALDFESEAIDTRPKYPPNPVGLAIYVDGISAPEYMAWGHPEGNNCTKQDAYVALNTLLNVSYAEYIFHNAPFDCSIIEEKMHLTVPWERVHDTMLQAFLLDPFGELSLKPLAELHLGEAPTERDAVRDWLVARGICRANDKSWGAHISKAPGTLVGPYAIGDVRKTLNLYKKFKAEIERRAELGTVQVPNSPVDTWNQAWWVSGQVPPEAYNHDGKWK